MKNWPQVAKKGQQLVIFIALRLSTLKTRFFFI